jgi:hypothetical protein
VKNLGGFKREILRCAQNDKNSLLIAHQPQGQTYGWKKDRGICLPGLFGYFQAVVRLGAVGAGFNTISQSIGGTGVSPVQAQDKACGYHKLPFDCDSV